MLDDPSIQFPPSPPSTNPLTPRSLPDTCGEPSGSFLSHNYVGDDLPMLETDAHVRLLDIVPYDRIDDADYVDWLTLLSPWNLRFEQGAVPSGSVDESATHRLFLLLTHRPRLPTQTVHLVTPDPRYPASSHSTSASPATLISPQTSLDPQGGDFAKVASSSAGGSPSVVDTVADAIIVPQRMRWSRRLPGTGSSNSFAGSGGAWECEGSGGRMHLGGTASARP
ncbi:hypothetical protein EW146_g9681 [Bondarzewia mesenterica]|uniref:Uncharacterized protein n=1 Tax=Bondarzewia mesenterica TaxID=1095465 RepID=A0A4S4L482_9AGAM|nr:hypothetical protein EW146_g9681 [Bondarzewia mesenterica]